MAHQLRQTISSHQIPKIHTTSGITIDPLKINDEFRDYITSLYSSETNAGMQDFDSFFSSLEIPQVRSDIVEQLEKPVTAIELVSAIKSMQAGKCPGPDGFPLEFYRCFQHKLAPVLIEMFNESFAISKLPPTLTQASISLILKKDKDPLSCSSYRPISLLNVDFKLLSKMLALRLETVLPSIISPDQTGFIKNRHSFFNLRRLFNTIYNLPPTTLPQAIISLDAEKAFDRVEWEYLFYTLDKFGFRKNFISWVKLLYSSPLASVRTNNNQSSYFPLYRSTRQGCPLSPLLFALAIEPLSIALRTDSRIKGIVSCGQEQKVSLYADDLLLFITDFSVSIPAALSLLDLFGSVSGYKLNLCKSELLPLNKAAREYPLHSLSFKIAKHQLKYLGVQVTNKFKDLYCANFTPLLTQVQKDFERWSVLTLSLAARINSIKMNILPQFLYLFQCIPVFLPQLFFRKLDATISDFIWNKKTPQLRRQFLQRPKGLGGIALPNLRFYYWAANLKMIHFWLHYNSEFVSPIWLRMERASCGAVSLPALAHSPIKCPATTYTKNVVVRTSLKVWNQFRRCFCLQTYSILAPITANHIFPPSLMDHAFDAWSNQGIRSFKDLYIDNIFISFEKLSEKFSLPKRHFFRYLQVRSFVAHRFSQFPAMPPDSPVDIFLKPTSTFKGVISLIYSQIHSLRMASLASIKALWEDDLGVVFDDGMWGNILNKVHHSSVCAKHGLIQCKVLHRAHLTKIKLSKIYKDVDPTCDRCHLAAASHIHMFWSCSALFSYWQRIFDTLSDVTGKRMEPNAVTALFGVISATAPFSLEERSFIAFVSLLARRLILLKWKSATPPSHLHWVKDVLYFAKLEKIRYLMKGSQEKFSRIWGPFFEHVGKLVFPENPE